MSMEENGKMSDDAMGQVAGGAGELNGFISRTPAGTCPLCGKNTREFVTRKLYTEMGPCVHTYYECIQCGMLPDDPLAP
ncbi:MAG: hypothetical protein J5546_09105 [Lachnospiraceae bacterium]|nr:hypothetical protein [Lachnospiraceae bacterium]